MQPLPAADLSRPRTIVVVDIERSTIRPDTVKAELRNKIYELFDAALTGAGIGAGSRDPFIDRGDGVLALIHPADQAPKAVLLQAIPAFNLSLTDYNASLPRSDQTQRQLRVRVAVHAGEVRYDDKGCFGETLDVSFRLLDSPRLKRALRQAASPLILIISDEIYGSIVRQGHAGIDQNAFHPLVHVEVAGHRYQGWIHIPE